VPPAIASTPSNARWRNSTSVTPAENRARSSTCGEIVSRRFVRRSVGSSERTSAEARSCMWKVSIK
jgi:hypothetical protein